MEKVFSLPSNIEIDMVHGELFDCSHPEISQFAFG